MEEKELYISHSAISDFEACPRFYYFRYLFRNPWTGKKIQVVDPYLTLGMAIHLLIEELASFPIEKRFEIPFSQRFEKIWQNYQGVKGGFTSKEKERFFKERGLKMVKRLEENPKIFQSPSYPIGEKLPKARLFPDKNIILVGSIDWIEILPNGKLHIIDFKTGQNEEREDSLQLPIYFLLAKYNFKKEIEKVSYWYLDKDSKPKTIELKPLGFYLASLREKALLIKEAVEKNEFHCPSKRGYCPKCLKYELAAKQKGQYLGFDQRMNRELYFVKL